MKPIFKMLGVGDYEGTLDHKKGFSYHSSLKLLDLDQLT